MEQFTVGSEANHWRNVIAGKFSVIFFFFWREMGWDKSVLGRQENENYERMNFYNSNFIICYHLK